MPFTSTPTQDPLTTRKESSNNCTRYFVTSLLLIASSADTFSLFTSSVGSVVASLLLATPSVGPVDASVGLETLRKLFVALS